MVNLLKGLELRRKMQDYLKNSLDLCHVAIDAALLTVSYFALLKNLIHYFKMGIEDPVIIALFFL